MINQIDNLEWLKLRSDIYVRDKAICWVCNEFVDLREYDLGHLVDRCNGGHDAFDNLAVMHQHCNVSKPRHTTLEEAMKWKLNHKYLATPKPTRRNMAKSEPSIITKHLYPKPRLPYLNQDDREAMEQLIIEYFNNHPSLLKNGEGYNRERIKASRELSHNLNVSMSDIRACLLQHRLVKQRPPQVTDGSQYHFVSEHLDDLLQRYENIKHTFLFDQPKRMGISHFCMDIMFYLSGNYDKVSKRNYINIAKRVARLGLTVRSMDTALRT